MLDSGHARQWTIVYAGHAGQCVCALHTVIYIHALHCILPWEGFPQLPLVLWPASSGKGEGEVNWGNLARAGWEELQCQSFIWTDGCFGSAALCSQCPGERFALGGKVLDVELSFFILPSFLHSAHPLQGCESTFVFTDSLLFLCIVECTKRSSLSFSVSQLFYSLLSTFCI